MNQEEEAAIEWAKAFSWRLGPGGNKHHFETLIKLAEKGAKIALQEPIINVQADDDTSNKQKEFQF